MVGGANCIPFLASSLKGKEASGCGLRCAQQGLYVDGSCFYSLPFKGRARVGMGLL
jgi:hypothetical protein